MNKKAICFDEEHMKMTENSYSTYLNWQENQEEIEERYEGIIDGMLFDVKNGRWWPGWGDKPTTSNAQEARVRALVADAPRIVPLVANCYLLIEPCQWGNPVLSIQQSDIIVYAPDLYAFLLEKVALQFSSRSLTGARKKCKELWRERLPQYKTIPFWGAFI